MCTLLVILGPRAASVVCAMKRKTAVRISRAEMARR